MPIAATSCAARSWACSTNSAPSTRSRASHAASSLARCTDRAVVVQPQHGDDVADIVVALDLARGPALLVGEDRVVGDPARVVELLPHGLGEAEVGDAVAVEVADLLAAHREAVLAAAADTRLDARPRSDLVGDDLAGAAGLRGGHACMMLRGRSHPPGAIGPRPRGPASSGTRPRRARRPPRTPPRARPAAAAAASARTRRGARRRRRPPPRGRWWPAGSCARGSRS